MVVLGISGSLRRESHNTKLLRAAEELLPPDAELVVFDELEAVPPYNEDRDTESAPVAARRLREAIAAVDAAKPVPVGAREVKEHLVVVDRQAVSVHQIGVQCASERRVGAEEADPGIEARPLSEYLIAQYLTTQ